MRLLTWNLKHGRDSIPGRGLHTWPSRLLRITASDDEYEQVNRSLFDEFAGWIAGRDWDVALLQEAPPRWLRPLAERSQAAGASVLTSRNSFAFARAALAWANPDLIASGEGGSNQLLVRPPLRIAEVRRLTLTERPERRRMLWALLDTPEGRVAVANLHASAVDAPAAARDVEVAARAATEWAGDTPLVLGGDFNLRPKADGAFFEHLEDAFGLAAPTDRDAIDHLLARGVHVESAPRRLPVREREVTAASGRRIRLSDHPPVVASLRVR